ncbi:MAG: hypothetical protein WC342_10695, partial [Methanoregula sp.]
PALFLTGIGAAVGIATINSVGNLGGFIGPSMMGLLTQVTGSMNAGLIAIGACLMLSGLLAIAIREKTGARLY